MGASTVCWTAGALLFAAVGCAKVGTTAPLVMLLIDTSGSMERKSNCVCTTDGCLECLPDCTMSERSRWIELLEILTGAYRNYACESWERTAANGATFDLGYQLPHTRARNHGQADDGLLDRYRERLRFGLATFDAKATYGDSPDLVSADDFDFEKSAKVDGMWSHNPERELGSSLRHPDGTRIGEFRYPNATTTYHIDTGIRGPQAIQGGLLVANDPAKAGRINDRIQESLLAVRPFGGTPTAAALDDLYYYLLGLRSGHTTNRPHVVLVTDGYPDGDFREEGCDCQKVGDPTLPNYCSGDPRASEPGQFYCPYPKAEEAARTLRCGPGNDCKRGVAEALHVVLEIERATPGTVSSDPFADVGDQFFNGSNNNDPVRSRLNAIAHEGGTEVAHEANDPAALRKELTAIFDEILAAP